MTKFKFSVKMFLFAFIFIVYSLQGAIYCYNEQNYLYGVLFSICFIGLIGSSVGLYFSFIEISSTSILSYSYGKRKEIEFSKISRIYRERKFLLIPVSIKFVGDGKIITVSSVVKNYKNLIPIAVQRCQEQSNDCHIELEVKLLLSEWEKAD